MKNHRILFCASEVSPYAKTGGLADVAGALPPALQQLGCDVRIFVPLYRSVLEGKHSLSPLAQKLVIPVGVHDYTVHLWESRTATGIPVYFLEKDEFYDRSRLYGSPLRGDYEDNAERFIIFCRSVYLLCNRLNWFPSVFHLHDWQTGLASVYHEFMWRFDPNFMRTGTVFTIHNLAFQGIFPSGQFELTHLPSEVFAPQGMEFYGQCNFLKAGLIYSDYLTTVSPTYSKEIQTPEFGYGLEGVLREREEDLFGILNGIDTTTWDPESDPLIPVRFSAGDLSGKRACKRRLLSELGFPKENESTALVGMISRLATQKGFDLVAEILDDLMSLPLCVIILGTGDANMESRLREMELQYPDKLKVIFHFDEALAHRIEAGADIFLMPSRYEPCGLNQMYSLRYGTIPVVHATGGLDDSVIDVAKSPQTGTGFKFHAYEAAPFLDAVTSALDLFRDEAQWRGIQKRAMAQDFSWNRSAREYIRIYEKVISKRAASGQAPSF